MEANSLLLNTAELRLLLENKRDKIGHTGTEGMSDVTSGFLFVITTLPATYPTVFMLSGAQYKNICLALGGLIMLYGAYKYAQSQKSKYGHERLLADIENLDRTEHRHSLVALKDTFAAVPSKYLLYYDEKWKCWFFFSYRTAQNDDSGHVRKALSEQLGVPEKLVKVKWVAERVQTKQSPTGVKTYAHKLYSAKLSSFPESVKATTFTLNGTRDCWMTLQEMEKNPEIQKQNLDVVHFVEESL